MTLVEGPQSQAEKQRNGFCWRGLLAGMYLALPRSGQLINPG